MSTDIRHRHDAIAKETTLFREETSPGERLFDLPVIWKRLRRHRRLTADTATIRNGALSGGREATRSLTD